MEKKPKILFDRHSVHFMLEALGYGVREDDVIIDKDGEPVLDVVWNETIIVNDLAGIHKSGLYKGDCESLIRMSSE